MDLKLELVADAEGNLTKHDLVMENGRLQTVDGINEIENRIICNLSVYLGENFTNPSFGTDYYGSIFGRDVTDTVVIDTLKAVILGTRGVTGLKTFDLAQVDGSRSAALTSQVTTTQGEINLVTPIPL